MKCRAAVVVAYATLAALQACSQSGSADGHRVRTSSPRPSWAPANPSNATPIPHHRSGVRLQIPLPGPVGPLAQAGDALYAVYYATRPHRQPQRIARVDLATNAVRTSVPLFGIDSLAIGDGALWATGASGNRRYGLYRFAAWSLRLQDVVHLASRAHGIALTPAGVWVGAGHTLDLIDPKSDRIERRVLVRGTVEAVAASPTGRLLYVSTSSLEGLPLTERDAVTGALRAVSPLNTGYSANWLAPIEGGVWMSSATGNFGGVFFLRARGLHWIGRTRETSQTVVGSVAARHLWIPGDILNPVLRCADLRTGRVIAAIHISDRLADGYGLYSNVVAHQGFLYVGASRGILRFPASDCSSRSPGLDAPVGADTVARQLHYFPSDATVSPHTRAMRFPPKATP